MPDHNKKTVSIVVPAWNEIEVLPELARRLKIVMTENDGYDFEVIIVENGSVDESFDFLQQLHEEDPRFKTVQLSRNFTADGGVAAGLRHASGDCAVLMDADLQDPPEVLTQFLEEWEKGNEVVYGVIRSREGVSHLRARCNKTFYTLLNRITKGAMPENVTAFRLMDRRVYEVLNHMGESNRFTRGLCAWAGFRQVGIEFDRADRFAGDSKAPFWDIFKEALDALFSFSFLPLKAISLVGLALSVFSFFFLAWQVISSMFFGVPMQGYLSIICSILLMFGFLFLMLGVVGEYLARIFDEVKARPLYVVKNTVGFQSEFSDVVARRMPNNKNNLHQPEKSK